MHDYTKGNGMPEEKVKEAKHNVESIKHVMKDNAESIEILKKRKGLPSINK